MTMVMSGTSTTISVRFADGRVERSTPGYVWVVRERSNTANPSPGEPHGTNLVPVVCWTKEAAKAYVERTYDVDPSEWCEGEPGGAYESIGRIAADLSYELDVSVEQVALA